MLTRLTQLFRADVHAVLDRIEEPEQLLRQSLRDMADALHTASRKLDQDRQRRAAMIRRQQEISVTLATLGDELELCLDAGNEDLARVLLRRRLEGERLLAHLLRQTGRLDAELVDAQRTLEQQRAQFEQLRQQAEAQAPGSDTDASAPAWSAEQFSVSDADVELALLRARRSRA
jgi:phage shock protein A